VRDEGIAGFGDNLGVVPQGFWTAVTEPGRAPFFAKEAKPDDRVVDLRSYPSQGDSWSGRALDRTSLRK